MKTMKLILTAVLALAMVGGIHAQSKNNEAEVTFSVSLHCEACKKKVTNSIPHEKGVKDLKADLAKSEVWVKFDSKKTDKEKLQKAIEKLGFTVTELVAETKDQKHAGCKAATETGLCPKTGKKCGGH